MIAEAICLLYLSATPADLLPWLREEARTVERWTDAEGVERERLKPQLKTARVEWRLRGSVVAETDWRPTSWVWVEAPGPGRHRLHWRLVSSTGELIRKGKLTKKAVCHE